MKDANEALVLAMFNLRMNSLGFSSYSGTPTKIDKGWAEMVLDRLDLYGFQIVAKPTAS